MNWAPSRSERRDRICTPCASAYEKARRQSRDPDRPRRQPWTPERQAAAKRLLYLRQRDEIAHRRKADRMILNHPLVQAAIKAVKILNPTQGTND